MNYRKKKTDLLLDLKQEEVRTLGIWGVKGIGKTTIAVEVFKSVSHIFINCASIPNVWREFVKHGKIKLQPSLVGLEEYTWNDSTALNLLWTKLKSKRFIN